MKIFPSGDNYIIVHTQNGSVHIFEEEDYTKVVYYDHFVMTIRGKHKLTPRITLDSDEYPTFLEIEETESKWIMDER